jgi:hypothetical protein
VVVQGCHVDVDAFGHGRVAVLDELGAEQLAGVVLAVDADVDRWAPGIMALVVAGKAAVAAERIFTGDDALLWAVLPRALWPSAE